MRRWWPICFSYGDRALLYRIAADQAEILRLLRTLIEQNRATGIRVQLGAPTDKPDRPSRR